MARSSRHQARSTVLLGGPAVVPPADGRRFEALPAGASEKVAIVVAHGIGQQVPFETLEGAARSIARGSRDGDGAVTVRMAKLGEAQVPRAEIRLPGLGGRTHEVHLYEIYWAPLTEGKVSLWNAVSFLLRSAWEGLLHGVGPGFDRWMFGGWRSFRKKSLFTLFQFAAGLLTVAGIVLMNASILVVAASRAIAGAGSPWSSDLLVSDVTISLGLVDLCAALLGVGVFAIPVLLQSWGREGVGRRLPAAVVRGFDRALVLAALGGLVVAMLLIPTLLCSYHWGRSRLLLDWPMTERVLSGLTAGGFGTALGGAILALWAIAIGASLVVRWFFMQFVGDLAAYISAHTVNKFYEVRQQIRQAALKVVSAIYRAGSAGVPEYSRVIVAGHSLGSVIAYDTLNALILEDEETRGASRVVERTAMLLTLGSPLDKTAFIFRNQKPKRFEIREALAAGVQSMIADYRRRPDLWVNVWSPDDWISGRLEYYDDREQTSEHRKFVINLADPEACRPIAAHTQYWGNRLAGALLHLAVTDPEEVRALAREGS